jgi:hypothetical protein
MYRLARPVLYRTINVEEDLAKVVHHFARFPGLASEVREFSVINHDCRYFDSIVFREEDFQWPEYMRSSMTAHPSFFSNLEGRAHGIYTIPPATLALMICPNIEILTLETIFFAPLVLPEEFLEECIALNLMQSENTCVPLRSLRKFAFNYPPWFERRRYKPETYNRWFSCLLRLPQIVSISLHDIPKDSEYTHLSSSNLRDLTLDHMTDLPTEQLENMLRMCPLLECLDLTWKHSSITAMSLDWAEFGVILTSHCPRLRKITLDNSRVLLPSAKPSGLMNLASLKYLRSLTLPVEAILSEPAGQYVVPSTKAMVDSPAGSNVPGVANDHDAVLNNIDDFSTLHMPGEGLNTPTVPLHQLLPPTTRYLKIRDDWDLWADAIRLDREIGALMLHPQFSELRTIRIKRKLSFTKHVKNIGWYDKRRQHFWNVLVRCPSAGQTNCEVLGSQARSLVAQDTPYSHRVKGVLRPDDNADRTTV